MLLAALLVQSDGPSRAARPEILDLHLQGRADARKAVCERGHQGAVAQIAQGRGWDRREQFPRPCQVKQPEREIRRGLTFGYPDDLCPGCNPSWCPKPKLDKAVSVMAVRLGLLRPLY